MVSNVYWYGGDVGRTNESLSWQSRHTCIHVSSTGCFTVSLYHCDRYQRVWKHAVTGGTTRCWCTYEHNIALLATDPVRLSPCHTHTERLRGIHLLHQCVECYHCSPRSVQWIEHTISVYLEQSICADIIHATRERSFPIATQHQHHHTHKPQT